MNALMVIGLLASALSVAPAFSQEQWGVAAHQMHVRAGPAIDYPVVAIVPAGAAVAVQGCLPDFRWCDVIVGPERGWSYAGNILFPHQGANVPLLTYGALIGIGIAGFSVGHYWDTHYRHRAWYPQRGHWMGRAPFPAGQPPGRAGFAPGGGHPPPQAGWAHGERLQSNSFRRP